MFNIILVTVRDIGRLEKNIRIHARIKEFLTGGGGGGVWAQLPKNSFDNVFVGYLVLNLFYSFSEGIQWLFQRKL